MFKLDEKHLQKAKEFAVKSRKKKSCSKCYDRGYIGLTPENTLVLCNKCVDTEKALKYWKEYIKDIPLLKEYYSDLFAEEDNTEDTQ
jgi:hypothetical protein